MEKIQGLFENFFNKTLNTANPGDSDWHLMTLFSIALQIKAENILELGVRFGDTSEPLLSAAHLLEGKLTCVDINPTEWQCPEELLPWYNFVLSDAIKFLQGEVEKKSIYDLIYIDDWHTYMHVKKELELIDKITTPKSVILLHDLMGFGRNPDYFLPETPRYKGGEWEGGGPYKAVKELDLDKWEWATLPVNHGLTILRKKSGIERD